MSPSGPQLPPLLTIIYPAPSFTWAALHLKILQFRTSVRLSFPLTLNHRCFFIFKQEDSAFPVGQQFHLSGYTFWLSAHLWPNIYLLSILSKFHLSPNYRKLCVFSHQNCLELYKLKQSAESSFPSVKKKKILLLVIHLLEWQKWDRIKMERW